MYRSKTYIKWLRQADLHWLCAKPKMPINCIHGLFQAEIIVGRTDKRRRDLGNMEKALMDWAQHVEIIDDDSLCQDMRLHYGEAPLGIRLVIKGVDKEN